MPDEVFSEVWVPPVSDASGQDRRMLRKAAELLNAAGWTIKDGKRFNQKGEQLAVEFLVFERVSEPHHALYLKNLGALGIDATVRLVEPVQYRSRIQDFDYDITMNRMVFSLTPGDTLRNFFSSSIRQRQGLVQLFGHRRPGGRRPDGARGRSQGSREPQRRLPRARPRAARRTLLGRGLVQAVALDRLLGHVRPAGHQAALRTRHPGNLVVSMPRRRRRSSVRG